MIKKIGKILLMIMLAAFVWQCGQKKIDVYMIGDSTMAKYDSTEYPLMGWGMTLPRFFNKNVTVHDAAVSGSSTKRFRDRLRWKAVYDSLQAGDYLFIQFGHNDEKEYDSTRYTIPGGSYNENLKRFIIEAREKGAIPILVTPIRRRRFDENGKLVDTHGKYPEEMRKVAKEMNVPLIDLTKLSKPLIESYGVEGSKKLFNWVKPGEYPGYPDGEEDNTHFSEHGAMEISKLAAKEILKFDLDLKNYIIFPKEK